MMFKLLTCILIVLVNLNSIMSLEPILLVHGGAGDIADERVPKKIVGVKAATRAGYDVLKNGGSVVDAVEAAIRVMEDDEAFNAGFGSVLNEEGEVEMDALIMDGRNLSAGAVSIVQDIQYPISLARLVMEKTRHVILSAHGAKKFAKDQGVTILPKGKLVSDYAKKALEYYKKHGDKYNVTETGVKPVKGEVGTVGAVAIDANGHVASATSTGGINGKMVGRVSDTSQIGSGGYADDSLGAVSTTGHGESIAKYNVARTILTEIEKGKSAQEATKIVIDRMTSKLKNTAGAITLSKIGEVGVYFSSKRMAWAYQKGNEIHYGVDQDQHEVENV